MKYVKRSHTHPHTRAHTHTLDLQHFQKPNIHHLLRFLRNLTSLEFHTHTYTTHRYIHPIWGSAVYPLFQVRGSDYKAQCVALRTGSDSESNTAQHVCCKSNYYSPPLNSGADPQSPKAIMRLGEGRRESHT